MPGAADLHAALKSSHKYYAWKLGLRAILLAVNIALIGLVAWIVDGLFSSDSVYTGYWDDWIICFNFIPVGISFIFCAVVLIYQLLRKRPVHPGWDVGVDLLLWLGFATLGGFTIAVGLSYLSGYYSDQFGYDGGDSGYYITAANGSSIWVPPDSDGNCPAFSSCAAQQAFYDSQRQRGIVEVAMAALMFFAMVLHFVMFVWGCVDTSKRNSSAVSRDAKALAQTMIAEMIANGQIPPPQQPLLFPGASQRASQVGSHASGEHGPAPTSPAHQAAYQQTSHGYYAPVSQQQQQSGWPLQAPAGQQLNEKQPLQANMPPPPRQMPMAPQGQAVPYSPHPQLSPPAPLSPMNLSSRAESPTIPAFGPSGEIRRQESNSPGPSAQNGSGWHTPPTQQAGGPSVPTRAPGHTATPSRRVSNASGSHRQSTASNDLYSR